MGDDERARGGQWGTLVVVALGVFMATLDTSIVNVSLPAVGRYFGVPMCGAIAWIVIAYLIVIAALLLTVGRIADIVGRRLIWVVGLAAFTLGSALCGLAPSLRFLIASRVAQGIGAAMIMAISPAMLTSAFPAERRGRALGTGAIFSALGVSAGPTLGGFLTERLSWRWIFFVNVPIGIAAVLAALHFLELDRPPRVRTLYPKRRFDVAGASLLGVGLATGTAALSFGNELGWGSPLIVAALVVASAAFSILVPLERRRGTRAIVDVSFFRDRVFASAVVALALSFLGLFATSFVMPFYLEQLRGLSTEQSGLVLTSTPLTIAVVSPISGAVADRIGSRLPCVVGMAVAGVGLVVVSRLGTSASLGEIIVGLVTTGLGQAMFQPANNSALMGAAPAGRLGVASGILATSRVVGQCLSVAVAGAIFGSLGASAAGHAIAGGAPYAREAPIFVRGFHAALFACAGFVFVAAIASAFRTGGKGHAPSPALAHGFPRASTSS